MAVLGLGSGCGLCCWGLVGHGGGLRERDEEGARRMREREQKRGAEENEELIEAILLCACGNGNARPRARDWVAGLGGGGGRASC